MEKIIKQKSLKKRREESSKLMKMNPSKIPIILDKNPNFPNLKDPTKHKFLLADSITMKQFISIISKDYLLLDNFKSGLTLKLTLYSTSDNIEISTNEEETILNIYNQYKDEDGFLYLKYSYEYIEENLANQLMKKFPEKLPIILNKNLKFPEIKDISQSKFLVANNFTIGEFISSLNKNYLNENEEKIFIKLANNQVLFLKNEKILDIFNKYKDIDDILYLSYFYYY